MPNTTPAETAAFVSQKLPTEIIGIICEFSDFKTHNAIRATCASVRLYVTLPKVAGFEAYKKLITLYKIECWSFRENIEETEKIRVFQERIHMEHHREELTQDQVEYLDEREKVFQERIHLDLHHKVLIQDQVEYFQRYELDYEPCRISRKVLDHPESYKGIDLMFDDCFFLTAASGAGDLELLIRLLQVPLMDPAAFFNRAIKKAARLGRLEIIQFLLQDQRGVDPSYNDNDAIICASKYGHLSVVQELMQDPRVDPSDYNNDAFRLASQYGHQSVVQALLKDPRVYPSVDAFMFASYNGHQAVLQALLQDPRAKTAKSSTLFRTWLQINFSYDKYNPIYPSEKSVFFQ